MARGRLGHGVNRVPLPPYTRSPSPPLSLAATPLSGEQVDLSWAATTDNVGAVAYQLERDSVPLPTTGDVLAHSERDVASGQTYTYHIRAADAAGNWSDWSQAATVDVSEDAFLMPRTPAENYGSRTNWGADAAAVKDSVLKVEVDGLDSRTVTSARLHLRCTNASNLGREFYAASGSWSEQTVDWNSAPAKTGSMLDSLGRVAAGQDYTVDLTGQVTEEGTYSCGCRRPRPTVLSMRRRSPQGDEAPSSSSASGLPRPPRMADFLGHLERRHEVAQQSGQPGVLTGVESAEQVMLTLQQTL